jgi:hypothetical protein
MTRFASVVKSRLRLFFALCLLWSLVVHSVITVGVWHKPAERATLLMADGLGLLWIVLGGSLMLGFREPMRQRVLTVPLDWRLRFVLFATLLALVEEATTTIMTNLAPVFGVPLGQAYITASTNYFDVVLLHSVIVFVPMFAAWTWLLGHYDFRPATVMLLFGITGLLAETVSFGPQNLLNAGFWILVYGLMVYLPAYSLPGRRAARVPQTQHYLFAVFLPLLCAGPVAH